MVQAKPNNNIEGIWLLWINWVLVAGALSALVVLSLWLSPVLMTLVAFGLQTMFYMIVRVNGRRQVPLCYLLPFLGTRIMFWTGLIMLAVNFLYSPWMIGRVFDMGSINVEIPFITVLIVSPVTLIVSLYAMARGSELGFCENCKARYGTPGERGFLGNLFSQEGRYQLRLMRNLSALLTIASWAYYAFEYVNVSLNQPDRYVFFWAPIAVFLFSIVFTGVRYYGLCNYYTQDVCHGDERTGSSTLVRFLIIWDNYLCVAPPESDPDKIFNPEGRRYDTPATLRLPFRQRISDGEATVFFSHMSHIADPDVRFMYSNMTGNADCNVFHYLVFLTDEQKEMVEKEHPDYRFLTLGEVSKLLNGGEFEVMLSAEVVRLHTIAMAWKTYDREGHRLYKIKHYTPTFRLRDVHKWTVDYNDPGWLRVSRINEDKPFYHLRRWWNRYVSASD